MVNLSDVVLLTGFRVGIVRYRGRVKDESDIFVGIEIFMSDSNKAGDSDGMYNGQRYFQCDDDQATFIPESQVKRVISSEELLRKLVHVNEQKKMLEQENKNYEVTVDLYLKKSTQWKDALRNLEIAHDELQSEVEYLKNQLMIQERDKVFNATNNEMESKSMNAQNDPFQMISNNDMQALMAYLSTNAHIINAFNDSQKGVLHLYYQYFSYVILIANIPKINIKETLSKLYFNLNIVKQSGVL